MVANILPPASLEPETLDQLASAQPTELPGLLFPSDQFNKVESNSRNCTEF